MQSSSRRCKQLRKLHDSLVDELRILKEDMQEEEAEGVANPVEIAHIIKSLQEALNTVTRELEKCPGES